MANLILDNIIKKLSFRMPYHSFSSSTLEESRNYFEILKNLGYNPISDMKPRVTFDGSNNPQQCFRVFIYGGNK